MLPQIVAGVVFGTYVCSSFILLKYPLLIHKKKKPRIRCQHISHRGGACEKLENTMTAFEHAVAVGTDMLELDCHMTRDGEVVVMHDGNLKRVAGVECEVGSLHYKELPLIQKELLFHPLCGPEKLVCASPADDRRFPLLRQVFEAFPNTPINIDLKAKDDRIVSAVSDLIEEFSRHDVTVWGNFSDAVVQKCYKVNPDVGLFFSLWGVLRLVLLAYSGLLPFAPLKETHLEIPLLSVILRGTLIQKKSWRAALVFIANFFLCRKFLFTHLEARGIHCYLWVLNEEQDFEKAFSLGVTGVMTDYPTKLKIYLDNRP